MEKIWKFLRLRSRARWQPFRETPWSRLWLFIVAAFLLFSVVGFFNDLMNMGTLPYAVVVAVAVTSGLNAVLWIVGLARLPRWGLWALIALQFVLNDLINWMVRAMYATFALSPVAQVTGVRFAGSAILAVVITSYIFFVNYFRSESKATARIRSELELAHGIQKTLVPPVWVRTAQFELYGVSEPSEKVGGDLVDAVLLPNGDIIAYVADIAGHGLAAGILMGMLKTAARTALLDAGEGHPGATLPLLLEKLNRVLPDVKEPQMYATLTAFRLNADGRVWYAMAASPPVLHWSAHRPETRRVQEDQYPLGLLPVSGFGGEALEMAAGDLLVVATDGVLEACDAKEEEFGIERLEDAIEGHASAPLAEMASTILRRARAFGKQTDDQTLLVVRRLQGAGATGDAAEAGSRNAVGARAPA